MSALHLMMSQTVQGSIPVGVGTITDAQFDALPAAQRQALEMLEQNLVQRGIHIDVDKISVNGNVVKIDTTGLDTGTVDQAAHAAGFDGVAGVFKFPPDAQVGGTKKKTPWWMWALGLAAIGGVVYVAKEPGGSRSNPAGSNEDREIAKGDVGEIQSQIKRRLEKRSGQKWSVLRMNYGWQKVALLITAPKARLRSDGMMTAADEARLKELLGFGSDGDRSEGFHVADSESERLEFLRRAAGESGGSRGSQAALDKVTCSKCGRVHRADETVDAGEGDDMSGGFKPGDEVFCDCGETIVVRGVSGSRRNPARPNSTEWRKMQIILEPELVEKLTGWHSGMDAIYALSSTGQQDLVSLSMIDAAIRELERTETSVKGKTDAWLGGKAEKRKMLRELTNLVGELQTVRQYWYESSADNAGMEIDDYAYDHADYGMTPEEEAEIDTENGGSGASTS